MRARTSAGALLVVGLTWLAPDRPGQERALPNDNTSASGTLENGVLSVSLEAREVSWHPDGDSLPGVEVAAFAEGRGAAVVPGPLLRVRVGAKIALAISNSIADTLTFFVPRGNAGQATPQEDSVVIPPGSRRALAFTAVRPGSYAYRATTSDSMHRFLRVRGALAGALVVDAAHEAVRPGRIFVLQAITDSLLSISASTVVIPDRRAVFAINGRSWPHTERIQADVGDTLRWRVINASVAVHPMHLHGFYFRVDDSSGGEKEGAGGGRRVVTERLAAFSAMRMTWVPEREGNWLFHCHFQGHTIPHRPLGTGNEPQHEVSARRDAHAGGGHERHALTGMGGLMLGIIVGGRSPEENERAVSRRHLRLVAIQDSGYPASLPSLRFRLEELGVATRDAGPGFSPPIEVERGQPVSIMVVNRMSEPTAVHWHGIELESYYDGVAGFGGARGRVSPIIAPRDSFEARFTPPRAGTFMYHSHVNEPRQHKAGLAGALIVRDGARRPAGDEFTFFLKTARADARGLAVEINGRATPDTLVLRAGRPARLRFINLTLSNHSANILLTAEPETVRSRDHVALLSQWRTVAKDGADLPLAEQRLTRAHHVLSIGETIDVEVTPATRGHLRIEVRATGAGNLLIGVPVRVE